MNLNPETVKALQEAIKALEYLERRESKQKELPENAGKRVRLAIMQFECLHFFGLCAEKGSLLSK